MTTADANWFNGKRASDDVPCAVPRDMRQAACGFNRQGSRAS